MLYYLRRLSRVGNRAPRNPGLRNPYQRDWVEEVLPEMFAIIKTGGKQFRVQNGDVIFVEKLNAAEGETVKFDVLLLEDPGLQVQVQEELPPPRGPSPALHQGGDHHWLRHDDGNHSPSGRQDCRLFGKGPHGLCRRGRGHRLRRGFGHHADRHDGTQTLCTRYPGPLAGRGRPPLGGGGPAPHAGDGGHPHDHGHRARGHPFGRAAVRPHTPHWREKPIRSARRFWPPSWSTLSSWRRNIPIILPFWRCNRC